MVLGTISLSNARPGRRQIMAFSWHTPKHHDGNYCVTPTDMRAWETAEIAEIPNRGRELMEIAGRSVAMYALEHYPNTHDALVFCGQGNNGGDALVAAWYLERCGIHIHLFAFDDAIVKTPDALTMLERVKHLPRVILRHTADAGKILEWTRRKDILVIDGIFGTGYRPTHSTLMTRVYQCIAELDCPVLSIDIPSGIDAKTGYRGTIEDESPPRALMATDTITFGAPKYGHFIGDGPTHCGKLHCIDIGLRPWPNLAPRCLLLGDHYCHDKYWRETERALDTHKGKCGHVLIVGGAQTMPGAACLAGRAALRAGAGLVTIAAKCPMHAPDEIMVAPILKQDQTLDTQALCEWIQKADVLVVGPGLGRDNTTLEIVQTCLTVSNAKLILDADALWALAQNPIAHNCTEVFLTPHPAEASRLANTLTREILFDPVKYARQIADQYAATCIIKAHTTIIATKSGRSKSNGRLGISPHPNPALATAGMGDVLAGILGGLLAQARNGAWTRWFDAFDIAAMAVNAHSKAGRKATAIHHNATCAGDLIENL